jgi:Zinc carboxypeptidase
MPRPERCLLGLLLLLIPAIGPAGPVERILPPELPWDGASRSFMVPDNDPWVTPSEVSGLTRTPSYDETVAWLERLAAASDQVSLVSLGTSHQGRDIWMVIASAGGAATPEALQASGKPLLLAHAGIHSGEIDGKDAGLMLLRDLSVRGTQSPLLDRVNLLFIPILSVDGHERSSPYGRINQRGPVEMGWRTNARNRNLNRDFAKLDTPEVRALISVINDYEPDLYVDLHVTDGADYQYDITWGYNGPNAYSPQSARWLDTHLTPAAMKDLEAGGHIPGPLIFFADRNAPEKGIGAWTATPRFSNGYGDLRHLPSVLVENHSLKPYDQRVLGTYLLLVSIMETLGTHGEELQAAVQADRARRPSPVPLSWQIAEGDPPTMTLKGVSSELVPSEISGGLHRQWTGQPIEMEIAIHQQAAIKSSASRPRAYWVPAAWPEVIERLELHGIRMERAEDWTEVRVEMYRIEDAAIDPEPFEGRALASGTPVIEARTERYAPGSARVPTDQPLGDLAVLLLEPQSPDSFFRWGFFLEILQRTEYVEEYVMEPMARHMLEENEDLRAEYYEALRTDPELAGSAQERLQWFYRRTPFFDPRWRLYPVGREMGRGTIRE